MMKTGNRVLLSLCCAALLCAMTGCMLAREDGGTDPREGRLVGVFVTTTHIDLFDFDGYISDNLKSFSGGELTVDEREPKYQGRIYASLVAKTLTNEAGETIETKEYVFDGLQGVAYFSYELSGEGEQGAYTALSSDEAISDGRFDINIGDGADSRTMEGTIYVLPAMTNVYYINPVYQSEDGSVYLTAGNGMSVSGNHEEGPMMTQTLDDAYTVTKNGKTETDKFSISIHVNVLFAPEKILILSMDGGGMLLSRDEYAPDALPEALVPKRNAAYLVVETYKRDAEGNLKISRELYDDCAESLTTFFTREDNICIKRETEIKWPGR